MEQIIINPSLSAAIWYNLFLNLPKFAEVSAIFEPANSTRTDYRAMDFNSNACWAANLAWPELKPVRSFQQLIITPTHFKVNRVYSWALLT